MFNLKKTVKRNTDLPEEKIKSLLEDQRRYANHDTDLCMLCHAYGADKRSLHMSVLYELKEIVPEMIDMGQVESSNREDYYLRICKHCRAELLGYLRQWRKEAIERREKPKDHDGQVHKNLDYEPIYVRINGESVPLTKRQYKKFQDEG